jgi:2,3-bisphosphoglycerate-independent phosphoglycerate mutase
MSKLHYDGPIVLAILDGVGLRAARSGNAVRQAHTEFLDRAMVNYLNIPLLASGEAVGIMPGQMGNSEVGHNAIGSGQIIKQGIAGIEAAFATGDIWQSKAWKGAMKWLGSSGSGSCKRGIETIRSATNLQKHVTESSFEQGIKRASKLDAKNDSPVKTGAGEDALSKRSIPSGTLHFCGIFSDGGVHSDIKHLEQMIQRAYDEGVRRIRIHCVFDGRDVAPQSEPKFIERIEEFCAKYKDADFRIASGAGRMVATADRYESDWDMVKLGWDMMVHGRAPRQFKSASEAVQTLRRENPEVQDQYLPAFVIIENTGASSALSTRAERAKTSGCRQPRSVGTVEDGDAFIYYDFRADRAVEIASAFDDPNFDKFDRGQVPEVYFAGLTEYDSDRHIPKNILVPPVVIESPLNVFLGQNKISQLAISETVKFGHITYYFNGNSYKKARGEEQIDIPSDLQPFNTRPWMKSAEITDIALEKLDQFKFIRLNYPGGDMVGHFAELEPTIIAMEAIDLQLARLAKKVDDLGGMMIITADHGNAEELLDKNGVQKTSHTSNLVPCIFYDNTANTKRYRAASVAAPGLANLAATIAVLLGLPDYPAPWQPPLIKA